MVFDGLVCGRLIRRYKRFLADVELDDGTQITVHCPNTGAMTGCAEPGSRVWLSVSNSPKRKYAHTWELVETTGGLACIHSAKANPVVAEGFASELIPGFGDYPEHQREVKYATSSRADLVLRGQPGQVYIEVKAVTLCREAGLGVFPDTTSDRARRHAQELASVIDNNTRAVMFFCVLHAGIKRVQPAADIDPAYAEALARAMEAGVEVMAWATKLSTAGITLSNAIPFNLAS